VEVFSVISEEVSKEELLFPSFGYLLDESDPDIVVLRRQNDAFVAAFSARGATREAIREAAQENYRALVGEHARSGDPAAEEEERGA